MLRGSPLSCRFLLMKGFHVGSGGSGDQGLIGTLDEKKEPF